MPSVIRAMTDEDFVWAAALLQRRRERYAAYSPVFWRPAVEIVDAHAEFLRATAARDGAVALRTDSRFALSYPLDGRCFLDDFAVEADDLWHTEGREVLLTVWASARSADQPTVRVVTARKDQPKRQMLLDLGLVVTARWWVKELDPTGEASAWGPVTLDGVDALIVPAPPVYDPGGEGGRYPCAFWATSTQLTPAPLRKPQRASGRSSPSCNGIAPHLRCLTRNRSSKRPGSTTRLSSTKALPDNRGDRSRRHARNAKPLA